MTSSETATALALALAVLEDGKAWTRGYSASDRLNQQVLPESPKAAKWCALGACDLVGGVTHATDELIECLSRLGTGCRSVPSVNDTAPSFAAVREMFERAIRHLEEPSDV